MPIKLITSILTVAIIGIFAGFNWGDESRCSVNFVFFQTPEIPVFLIIIVSFLLGVVAMSLLSICNKMFGHKKVDSNTKIPQKTEVPPVNPPSPQTSQENR